MREMEVRREESKERCRGKERGPWVCPGQASGSSLPCLNLGRCRDGTSKRQGAYLLLLRRRVGCDGTGLSDAKQRIPTAQLISVVGIEISLDLGPWVGNLPHSTFQTW